MTDLLRNLTVRELMVALAEHDPDAVVVMRRSHPFHVDLVVPVQHAVAKAARDFAGYRNLDIVLEDALTPTFTGGEAMVVVVLGEGKPAP